MESFKQQTSPIVSVLRYKKGFILMFFIKSKCCVFIHLADIKYFYLSYYNIKFYFPIGMSDINCGIGSKCLISSQ